MRYRFILVLLAVTACSKSEAPTPAPAESAASPIATASATAPKAATSETAPSSPSPTPATSASAAPVECGTKLLPDCPLQAWMKSNLNPPVMRKDTAALATALEKAATFAPPGYTNWASISKDGAAAARGGDLDAAKAACSTCHNQYKQKYKTEIRARKL